MRFAPEEVEEYPRLLNCVIPHLDSGYKPLSVPLKGKVLRPWCHFEMPESDYLSAGRRNPELPGPAGSLLPLDPATRVLEYESLGTKVKNLKRFFILNPTNVPYEFVWEAEETAPDELPRVNPFRCLTKRGVIMGGKKYEIMFEYTPDSDDIAESFWRFRIPEQDISVPFLLVGLVVEPDITLDRAGLNYGKVLLGARARDTVFLVNNEELPFPFSFDPNSFEAGADRMALTGKQPVVEINPVSGVLQPKQRLAVQVGLRGTLNLIVLLLFRCDFFNRQLFLRMTTLRRRTLQESVGPRPCKPNCDSRPRGRGWSEEKDPHRRVWASAASLQYTQVTSLGWPGQRASASESTRRAGACYKL